MSGVTINNITTSESLVSACGGVTFATPTIPNHFTTNAETGTDCLTSEARPYDATPSVLLGGDAQSITLTRSIITAFEDDFAGTNGDNIAARPPTIGTGWNQLAGPPNIQLTGASAATVASGGTARYTTNPAPTGPDFTIQVGVAGDAGFSDVTEILARWDEATQSGYVLQIDTAGAINLIKRIAGVDTVLQAAAFTMPAASDPPSILTLTLFNTNVIGLVNNILTVSASDATFSGPNVVGIQQIRSVGQPVFLTNFSLTE